MCSTITQHGVSRRIGRKTTLEFVSQGSLVSALWTGYARGERWKNLWKKYGILVKVPAESYVEHGHTFNVPQGKSMLGVVLTRPFMDHPAGSLALVTRLAKTDEERRVHPRHPVFVDAA